MTAPMTITIPMMENITSLIGGAGENFRVGWNWPGFEGIGTIASRAALQFS